MSFGRGPANGEANSAKAAPFRLFNTGLIVKIEYFAGPQIFQKEIKKFGNFPINQYRQLFAVFNYSCN